ncbi:hypothetical protein LTR85_010986 [Meristemomyces frigidus]|nr:hypothetical protein LTR85_010986 [Meristemomyces frigidus]
MAKRNLSKLSEKGGKKAAGGRSKAGPQSRGYSANGRLCFFDLPAEVRVMIYAECRPAFAINIASRAALGTSRQQSLLRAHPVIRREFVDFYYQNNVFWLDVWSVGDAKLRAAWQTWFATLDERDAAAMRRVKFYAEHFSILVKLAPEAPRVVMEVQMRKEMRGEDGTRYYGRTLQELEEKFLGMQAAFGDAGAARGSACFRKSDVDSMVSAVLRLFPGPRFGRQAS